MVVKINFDYPEMIWRMIVECWIHAAGFWLRNAGFWIEKLTGLMHLITKGLTNLYACEPFMNLVGGTGFEPVTSTV